MTKPRASDLVMIASVALAISANLRAAPSSDCVVHDATPPAVPLVYPTPPPTVDRYAVQYGVDGGPWTSATVYISVYGGTLASPFRDDSGYSASQETSLSFVSIPAHANAAVRLRVTKLFGTPFEGRDRVSVRPSVKRMDVDTRQDGSVEISTATNAQFAGEQFVLWWERGTEGAAIEGLAFFLDPPYAPPAITSTVRVIRSSDDLDNLDGIDTLDFEGIVPIGPAGDDVFSVPPEVLNIFLGPGAWVQGKLRFEPETVPRGQTRTLWGPGVLDGSRFDYESRACGGKHGYYALSSNAPDGKNPFLDRFVVDGITIADHNHAANDVFFNSRLNNVKTISWNGENAALRLGNHTVASNLFVRSGDDSLMMWGTPVTVTNATVWQNYNGGVVNLGWSNNASADGSTLDGLYVVKTDWLKPTDPETNWILDAPGPHQLANQNNAVFASLMTPGTMYGTQQPPIFRNIFVEDAPQVLFSLKILPPICGQIGQSCPSNTLTDSSMVNLEIENLFSPVSIVDNSIGFETLPAGYTQDGQTFLKKYTLKGSMNVGLTNVFLKLDDGFWLPLTRLDADTIGKVETRGHDVHVTYRIELPDWR
jgi:hypothetical protein